MKIIFFIILLKSIIMAEGMPLPEATVAVVNGFAVSEDELNREVGRLLPNTYYHSTLSDDKLKSLKEKSLESLIEKNLLYRYALSKKIHVSSDELEAKITSIQKAYKSKDAFKLALKKIGHSKASFEKEVKKDEVLIKLYLMEIEVKLSEEDLKNYYDENIYKFREPEKIKVSLIYVRNDPTDPNGKSKSKKKIEEAASKLKDGENFAFVAQTYSNDPSRVKGGDLGFLHRGRLDPAIEEEAFSIDANSTSGIIEKDIGFYIVRVEEKKEQKQFSFEEIKDGLKTDLKEKEEAERKSALLKKLLSTAVIVK